MQGPEYLIIFGLAQFVCLLTPKLRDLRYTLLVGGGGRGGSRVAESPRTNVRRDSGDGQWDDKFSVIFDLRKVTKISEFGSRMERCKGINPRV